MYVLHSFSYNFWELDVIVGRSSVIWCCWNRSSSCSTSYTRRVNLVTNSVIIHEWGKDREAFTTSGTYAWSFL